MTYTTQSVSAMTDIPAHVATFAAGLGWTVDTTNPNQPIFSLPGGGINWQLLANVSGVDHDLTFQASGSAVPTSVAKVRSPKLAPPSGTTAAVPAPSVLHMFGTPSTETVSPYIALVIEYTSNLFRHLYLGKMEKMGDYTGGEIVSGCGGPIQSLASSYNYNDINRVTYLFRARSTMWADTLCGGVHVNHADNATPWRVFYGSPASPINGLSDGIVLGGFGDAINDGYLARGESPFAAVNMLVSPNLYITQPVTNSKAFVPIGRPPGVRMVNMKNLDPGSQISVGGNNWRVFPAWAKSPEKTMPNGNGNWRQYESSYYVGYAYREA